MLRARVISIKDIFTLSDVVNVHLLRLAVAKWLQLTKSKCRIVSDSVVVQWCAENLQTGLNIADVWNMR
jgi:hypothetical protein